jgi:hypothetical protein
MAEEAEAGASLAAAGEAEKDRARNGNSAMTNSNNFVIREGFPALYKTSELNNLGNETENRRQYLVDGEEPIPMQSFVSFDRALQISQHTHKDSIIKDCETVFTARTKDDGEAYSAGQTYFVPCHMKPRCALEAMALQIFKFHTKHLLAGTYNPEQSGAEWWTLVLDSHPPSRLPEEDENDDDDNNSDEEEDDDVGMHFDADYGLEAQVSNMMVHPRLATVTYLSDVGVPTLILNQKSPTEGKGGQELEGMVNKGWLSAPHQGKHIAFDGRLLHGAPGYIFPGYGVAEDHKVNLVKVQEEQQNATKRLKQNGEVLDVAHAAAAAACSKDVSTTPVPPGKRVTFMVNLWLNHCPLDAELLEDEVCEQLETPWKPDWWKTVSPIASGAKINPAAGAEGATTLENLKTTGLPTESPNVSSADNNSTAGKRKLDDAARKKETGNGDAWQGNPVFSWNALPPTKETSSSSSMEVQAVALRPCQPAKGEEPVGEEETVICQRTVTFLFNMMAKDCRMASHQACRTGSSVELNFVKDAFMISVGDEVPQSDDDGDGE